MVLLTSAMVGIGLIVVNQWIAQPLMEQGRLTRVLSDYVVSPRPGDADFYAVYASSRGMSRKVRAFVDFLAKLGEKPDSFILPAEAS